jgi:hypothetical protein
MDALLEHDADILRPPWGVWGRDATLGLVSSAAKLLLRSLNTLRVDEEARRRFERLVTEREPGVGLLTYCNHTRCVDVLCCGVVVVVGCVRTGVVRSFTHTLCLPHANSIVNPLLSPRPQKNKQHV